VSFLIPEFKQVPIEKFVEFWKPHYRQTKYPESQYRENAEVDYLEEENLKKLFEWKLGREIGKTAEKFRRAIYRASPEISSLNDFKHRRLEEQEFLKFLSSKKITEGRIYQPFFFHICRPLEFALYDQHVYRSWQFLVHSEIKEVPNDFEEYKRYNEFFSEQARKIHAADQWEARRRLDKALLTFGKFLKQNAYLLQSKETEP